MAMTKKKKKVSKKKSAGIVIPKTKKKSAAWKTKTKKKPDHYYKPGESGNPAGRPKGSTNRYSIKNLMDAIAVVEKKEGKQLLQEFVGKAYEDKTVMIALMKKLLPDLKSIDTLMATFETSMDEALAKQIQAELLERYK